MYEHAHEHTRLINKFIGLCKNTVEYPSTLRDLGFQVEFIEEKISLGSAEVVPDVIAVSNKLTYVILAECKTGSIDTDQNTRYLQITSTHLSGIIKIQGSNSLSHIVCYVDNESNHASCKEKTDLPFITFSKESINGSGDFKNKQINESMRLISLDGMKEPTGYYPFSPDESDKFIMEYIIRGLVCYITKRRKKPFEIKDKSSMEEVFKIIYSNCYKLFSKKHKNLIVTKIKETITSLQSDEPKFKERLVKIESGEYSPATLDSFKVICEKIIQERKEPSKLSLKKWMN